VVLKKCFFLFLGLGFCFALSAQTTSADSINYTSSDSLAYYLDTGSPNKIYKSSIKINPIAMLNGDIPIYVDIYLSKLLNIEFGAGVIRPYYIVGYSFEEYQQTILNSDSGYSLWLHPKFFFNRKDNKDSFCSVAYRYRAFNEGTLTTTLRDISLNWGYSIIYPNRIALDAHVG
jgi:hypothetical protein